MGPEIRVEIFIGEELAYLSRSGTGQGIIIELQKFLVALIWVDTGPVRERNTSRKLKKLLLTPFNQPWFPGSLFFPPPGTREERPGAERRETLGTRLSFKLRVVSHLLFFCIDGIKRGRNQRINPISQPKFFPTSVFKSISCPNPSAFVIFPCDSQSQWPKPHFPREKVGKS